MCCGIFLIRRVKTVNALVLSGYAFERPMRSDPSSARLSECWALEQGAET